MSKNKNILTPEEVIQITCPECNTIYQALLGLSYTRQQFAWAFRAPESVILTVKPEMRVRPDSEKEVHVSAQHKITSEKVPNGKLNFSSLCIIFSQGFLSYELLKRIEK